MNKNITPLIIDENNISPGERKTILLPMPKLYDWTPLSMPIHVIRGKLSGPTLCITSTIHGDEVNGIEIVRRLLKKPVLKNISGTLIAIPIINIYGFLYQDRYLMDRRDLNRSFPGSKEGSVASRLAYQLTNEIISQSTHIIDLHTGSLHRSNLPQIRVDLDVPGARQLSKSFNVPVVLDATLRDGSLRQYANERSIPFLLYEAGEALRFDELSIKTGVNGILNVMNELKMIKLKKKPLKNIKTAFAHNSYWIRAPHGGILHPTKSLGKKIEKGELLATICNPSTTEEYRLKSPLSGIIIGKNNLPMVHEGAALFHIATFKKLDLVAEQVEYLQESSSDGMDYTYNR